VDIIVVEIMKSMTKSALVWRKVDLTLVMLFLSVAFAEGLVASGVILLMLFRPRLCSGEAEISLEPIVGSVRGHAIV
jgi:hypothetical protein